MQPGCARGLHRCHTKFNITLALLNQIGHMSIVISSMNSDFFQSKYARIKRLILALGSQLQTSTDYV